MQVCRFFTTYETSTRVYKHVEGMGFHESRWCIARDLPFGRCQSFVLVCQYRSLQLTQIFGTNSFFVDGIDYYVEENSLCFSLQSVSLQEGKYLKRGVHV